MKKMFVGLAACALIFTGCSNNEVLENTSPSNAIQFSNLNNRLTKSANNQKSDYKVLAAWSEFDAAWYMNGSVDGTNDTYFPLIYWPEKGSVDFYAYCPGTTAFSVTPIATSAIEGIYTVGPTAKEDFTIAEPVTGADSKKGTVGLVFEHMLSRITMTVAIEANGGLQNYEISASSAAFTLDYNSATFNVMSQNPKKEAMGNLGSKGTNNYTMTPGGHALISVDYLNVLPQPLSDKSELTLTISVKPVGIGENIIENKKLKAIKLKGVEMLSEGFETGKWYQFTVTISSSATDDKGDPVFDQVQLSSIVSGWDQGSSTIPQP